MQVLFVTVDPERDTPEVLRQYVPAFHPSFLGLFGDAEATARTAKEFKIFYQKQPLKTGGYSVDHSAGTYIFDREGRLRLFAPYGQGATPILARHPRCSRRRCLSRGSAERSLQKQKAPAHGRGFRGAREFPLCRLARDHALHLRERLDLDLPHALGRHAEFGGEIVQGGRILLGEPARLDDAAAARVQRLRGRW